MRDKIKKLFELQLRYFLEIAYKGTKYHGWQVQKNAHTVQQELNNSLQRLFQKKIETLGSGRTDTGVHAEQQFVHMDLDKELNDHLIFKLNCILPKDIVIKNYFKVKDKASARFDATSRTYEYRISRVKNPFQIDSSCFFGKDLDVEMMKRASKVLLKHTDFQSFSKVNTSVDHFLCDIFMAEWTEKKDMLIFKIEANRFLRGMVRTVVGTLLEIGQGRMTIKQLDEIIRKKDRKAAGAIVPAEGLYLTKIKYPKTVFIKSKGR